MRRILLALLIVLLLALPAVLPTAPAATLRPGRFFVAYVGQIPPDTGQFLNSLGATVLDEMTQISAVYVSAQDGPTLRAGLANDPRIRYVAEEGVGGRTFAQPADPDLAAGRQNHLAIQNIPAAWAAGLNGSQNSITVAFIDTGIRTSHPDLAPNLWPNASSQVHGYNLVHPIPDFFGNVWLDHNIEDTNGHGTLVAGVLAAAWNSIGIAGVAGNSKLLTIRAWGTEYMYAEGIILAVDNGARVVVVPMGMEGYEAPTGPLNRLDPPYPAMHDAVKYARAKNAVVVASAGNPLAGVVDAAYPAAFDETIAVTALDILTNGDLSAAVDYRRDDAIDLAAPHNVWTTCASTGTTNAQMACSGCPVHPPADSPSRDVTCGHVGTSFSAPQVGGVAALMFACRPLLTADNVVTILTDTAKDVTLGPDADIGRDTATGHGIVNATLVYDWIKPCSMLPWTGPPTSGTTGSGGGGSGGSGRTLYMY